MQSEFKSDITLTTLIHAKQLETREKLDRFIGQTHAFGHRKFSTLSVCNDWTKENQKVDYLDSLPCEWVVLFNEILGQKYRGTIIKRYDRQINNNAIQSFKFHVDGNISTSWVRA